MDWNNINKESICPACGKSINDTPTQSIQVDESGQWKHNLCTLKQNEDENRRVHKNMYNPDIL